MEKRTLLELLEWDREDKLALPNFQRDYVWKEENIKQLIASFLVKSHIGTFLLVEGKKGDFASRRLCFPRLEYEPKEQCYYLLDGQQRLSTLRVVFDDIFKFERRDWKENWENTYKKLRTRWFLRIKPDLEKGEEDIFGWDNLNFYDLSKFEPQDVIDFVEYKSIKKTRETDSWYHPARFSGVETENINEILLEIAREAVGYKYLVPLYTLYEDSINDTNESLLYWALDDIASRRVKELQAEVKDGKKDIVEILKIVDPKIKEYVTNNENEKIEKAWLRLQTRWVEAVKNYLRSLLRQEIFVIILNDLQKAVSIFENINKGGTPLSVYDLVVAKAAKNNGLAASRVKTADDDFEEDEDILKSSLTNRIINYLKEDFELSEAVREGISIAGYEDYCKWNAAKMMNVVSEDNTLSKVIQNQYLNLLSITVNCGEDISRVKVEYIKKASILRLSGEQINKNTEYIIKSLARALAFLHFRCGIFNINEMPYELMFIPIAFYLGNDSNWEDIKVIRRLEYWYWVSLFGGAYRENQNFRVIEDLKNLNQFLHIFSIDADDSYLKSTYEKVLNYQGYSSREVLMRREEKTPVPGAVEKAILQYILSKEPHDWNKGGTVRLGPWMAVSEDLHMHHIIPLGSVTKIGESADKLRKDKSHILNSPLNKTYITKSANNRIKNKSIDDYYKEFEEVKFYEHFVPPIKGYNDKKSMNFYKAFLEERFNLLQNELKSELAFLIA
ncbi:DUF262 domain-containing protein [Thermosyntropha sp.]|uniref:DUF262 domain-containing protein n=1 Tax=Thermosyntropha sp. TaxID=2740820 RepID=UPI0025E1258C|nr:DUF262 domain-containing protein [Thermosyntropha sp.]MBO8159629.1 DUF262 domain-containing protein [Thermosyntropha sp.]